MLHICYLCLPEIIFFPGETHCQYNILETTMSIIRNAEASCTKCGAKDNITIYRSINVSENPELKDKVKDGSLFLWKCPSCGQVNLAKFETLYHDPDKKLMIWLLPDGIDISEAQMNSISLHAKAIGNYTLRLVSDTGSLMEKVLVADAGLDDAVIEICKYVTKMEIMAKTPDKEMAGNIASSVFHFYSVQGEGPDRTITLMYPSEGRMTGVSIGYNVYEDCLGIMQRNPAMKPGEGFERIDSAWLESHIR